MANDIGRALITETEIKKRMTEMVLQIYGDCKGKELIVIGILKGSFMFMADLLRSLYLHDIHPLIDFMIVSSYGHQTTSSGMIKVERDITTDIKNHWVLVVDDILDTGRTLSFVKNHLLAQKPQALKVCVLLDKPSRRLVECRADYVGFKIEDYFVIGYGLDYNSRYRDLPFIAILNQKNENIKIQTVK